MIKAMVVDDHELVRAGISRLISDEADMEVIALAASGEETLRLLRTIHPNVILIDITMPGMSGMEAIQRISRQYPDIRLIAMSTIEAGMIPARMLRAGATAFLSKNVSVEELGRAIRTVYLGQRYITHRLATQLALESMDANESPFDSLSEREMQVALMLIDCNSINTISGNLSLSPKTVYSYRYRIFEKLGIKSDAALIILAVRHGLSPTPAELLLAT
ncbi:MAG: response regulator [Pseudomonadales bacterium]|nr:response regulator [Pseudomonadales bacterium]